jgi:hypothetical protein
VRLQVPLPSLNKHLWITFLVRSSIGYTSVNFSIKHISSTLRRSVELKGSQNPCDEKPVFDNFSDKVSIQNDVDP